MALGEGDGRQSTQGPKVAEPPEELAASPGPSHDPEYEEPAVKAIFPPSRKEEAREVHVAPLQEPFSPSSNLPEVDTSGDEPLDLRPSLGKRPSTVREEPEPEPYAPQPGPVGHHAVFEVLDAIPMRRTVYERHGEQPRAEEREARQIQIHAPTPIAPTSPIELPTEGAPRPGEARPQEQRVVAIEPREARAITVERTHSSSPARSAHFGTVHESLAVRHSPPPRAASPRKSALKQTSPTRGASPPDDGEVPAAGESATRRKSARVVSFDDANTRVVGEAASPEQTESPLILSPQTTRRPWYSNIGLGKKKDLAPLEEEEIMKPRPALPSFGSVRERKQPKEHEERPLVRPLESSYSPPLPDSPGKQSTAPVAEQTISETLGESSDHAIGSVLAQDHASRHPANISRFREPLPPVVTSMEGHEYVSDTSSSDGGSSLGDDDLVADTPVLHEEESQATTVVDVETAVNTLGESAGAVEKNADHADDGPGAAAAVPAKIESPMPSIFVTHPSQERVPQLKPERRAFIDVPGTFPEDESDSSAPSQTTDRPIPSKPAESSQIHAPAARQATFEPVSQADDGSHGPQTRATVLATHIPVLDEESDETGSSIYSDAYEDLSDVEEHGFQSLDAVVESPIATSVSKSPFGSSNSTPQQLKLEAQHAVPKAAPASVSAPQPLAPRREDDWEIAKAYWRTLTAEKRAQLEREAVEEAAADADLEVTKPPEKPRRKKSMEKRQAERKAIQESFAQADPERTYMITPGTKAEGEIVKTPKTRMRTSMRGDGAPTSVTQHQHERPPETLRTSLRASEPSEPSVQTRPRATLSKAARPMSFPPPGVEAPRVHGRTLSDSMTPQKPPGRTGLFSSLRRRGSDSSESSFRRSRPQTSGGFGFRRTLREASPPVSAGPGMGRGGRHSLRSLSPPGSPFRSSTGYAQPRMQTTLRGSPDAKPHKTGGIHLPSFGRASGSKAAKKSKSGFSSRFGDSSDEDKEPSRFRSRFDDSSDEERGAPARPLSLGISKAQPREKPTPWGPPLREVPREARVPSPDLPDSSDEERHASVLHPITRIEEASPSDVNGLRRIPISNTDNAIGTSTIRRSRSGRGGIEHGLPLSPSSPGAGGGGKRGSLLSVLRRRKGGDAGGGVRRGELMDSAARRDTQLERSVRQLEAVRSTTPTAGASASGGVLKLQKRGPAGWPLPMPEDEADDDSPVGEGSAVGRKGGETEAAPAKGQQKRPATSGNIGITTATTASSRPAVLQRRSLSQGNTAFETAISSGSAAAAGAEKKKKRKFSTIRRMLRLDD